MCAYYKLIFQITSKLLKADRTPKTIILMQVSTDDAVLPPHIQSESTLVHCRRNTPHKSDLPRSNPTHLIAVDEPGQIGRGLRVVRGTVANEQLAHPVVRFQSRDVRFVHRNVCKKVVIMVSINCSHQARARPAHKHANAFLCRNCMQAPEACCY